ncbi:MAG: cadherin repeat domain-containing protein [Dehalococcoidia bacterium]|nr:cadherin repeat domain-containing protein [Dehalococcoidia bacterium]
MIITPGGGDALGSGVSGRPGSFPISLEEIAVEADVIARVNLLGVSTSTDIWQMDDTEGFEDDPEYPGADAARYVGTLDYRFRVAEYLKGTGDIEVVARVRDFSHYFGHPTSEQAQANANQMLADRNGSWDRHEAIVFLQDRGRWTAYPLESGEYEFGYAVTESGEDGYTITSPDRKKWLPAVSISSSGRMSGQAHANPSYYLDAPGSSSGGISGQSDSASTITLTDIRAKIDALEEEIAAGDGSQAFRDCVQYKYFWKRSTDRRIEKNGGTYPYRTYSGEIGSGLPAGTQALAGPQLVESSGDLTLRSGDADLFTAPLPVGDILTTRPLPAGEYRFFYFYRGPEVVPCNGHPIEWETDDEVILTVTAPEGTVHEAFFDPISSGSAVGYFGTGDALINPSFELGDGSEVTIESLAHQGRRITVKISPYNSLEGLVMDFIALDGTTTLTLKAGTAIHKSNERTLAWLPYDAPWREGDQLMLRLRPEAGPVFEQDSYSIEVPESTSTWSYIGKVRATDQDVGDAVGYRIISGNANRWFDVDLNYGDILLMEKLDYETRSSYELTVEARGQDGKTDTATVTVNVTDVAE